MDPGETQSRPVDILVFVTRTKSILMLFVSLVAVPLVWFIGGRFDLIAAKTEAELAAPALWMVEHRIAMMLLPLVAAGLALAAVMTRRASIAFFVLSFLALLGVMAVVLVGFVQILGPLYEVQPL